MAKKKEEEIIDVGQSIDKAEAYVQENKRSLTIIGVAIALVVGAYFIWTNFIVKPQEESAMKEMYVAERYFQSDSFKLALNGDGNYPGFLQIIDDYGFSKSANLAHFYAGISYLKIGDYEKAIKYLKKYDYSDAMTGAIANGGIGDAYLESGDKTAAIKYYKKAIDWNDNKFSAPVYMMKLAMVHEMNGDFDKALKVYQNIKKEYPSSNEGRNIEKYIASAEIKAGS